jgi:hypothetical protein
VKNSRSATTGTPLLVTVALPPVPSSLDSAAPPLDPSASESAEITCWSVAKPAKTVTSATTTDAPSTASSRLDGLALPAVTASPSAVMVSSVELRLATTATSLEVMVALPTAVPSKTTSAALPLDLLASVPP